MNKNSENYKNTYSQLRPSAEAVERVMDMTSEKKIRFKPMVKRLAAAAIALAILIGGGLGINLSPKQNEYNDELGVLIAYASTGILEVGQSTQELFYSLHIIPENDEIAAKAAREKLEADKKKLEEDTQNASALGSSNKGHLKLACWNTLGAYTATLYGLQGGFIILDLDDYSDVKTFKVESTDKYGEVSLNIHPTPWLSGSKIEVTGEQLRNSRQYWQDLNVWAFENKGYAVWWKPSEELCKAIGNNTDFDLSKIEDTIKFTVEFNDGTIKTGSINLYFDSDGYMHFGK